MPTAEDIYLFSHAAYRDVAYALQLPSERGRLHDLAMQIMEQAFAAELDTYALELAAHARLARQHLPAAQAEQLAAAEARYIMRALIRADSKSQMEAVLELSGLALSCPALTTKDRAVAMSLRGTTLRDLGRPAEAIASWIETTAYGRAIGDAETTVSSLTFHATVLLARGKFDEGYALLDEAESLAIEHKLTERHALALVERAFGGRDDLENERLLQKALGLLKEMPDCQAYSTVEGSLANLYANTGRRAEAIRIFRRLVETFTRHNRRRFVAVSLANLGRQLMLENRLEEAEHSLSQAVSIAQETGNGRTRCFALANLAEVQMHQGRLVQAAESIQTALDMIRDFELPLYNGAYRCTLAALHLLRGGLAEASEIVDMARHDFESARGADFIAEYCGIVRLRIAADYACLGHQAPAARWLPVMRAEMATIDATYTKRGREHTLLHSVKEAAVALLAEVEDARRNERPALVYRGHLPSELSPPLRKALCDEMTPKADRLLLRQNAQLWEALHQ